MLDLVSIRADLSEIVADLPVTCSFADTSFTATSTDSGESRTVEIDGELTEIDRTIVCDVDDVPASVESDKQITVDGTTYRILRLSLHQDGVGLEIDLKAVGR